MLLTTIEAGQHQMSTRHQRPSASSDWWSTCNRSFAGTSVPSTNSFVHVDRRVNIVIKMFDNHCHFSRNHFISSRFVMVTRRANNERDAATLLLSISPRTGPLSLSLARVKSNTINIYTYFYEHGDLRTTCVSINIRYCAIDILKWP